MRVGTAGSIRSVGPQHFGGISAALASTALRRPGLRIGRRESPLVVEQRARAHVSPFGPSHALVAHSSALRPGEANRPHVIALRSFLAPRIREECA